MSPVRFPRIRFLTRRVHVGDVVRFPERPGAGPATVIALFAAAAGLVAAGFTAAFIMTRPPRYASVAGVFLDQPKLLVESESEAPTTKLNMLRLKYASLLRTRTFTDPIAERLGIRPQDVASSLRFSARGFTLTLLIEARAAIPSVSMRIAEAAARELVDYLAREQQRRKVPEDSRIIASVTGPAGFGFRLEPTTTRIALLAGIAGILAFGGVLMLIQMIGIRRP